MTVRGVRVCYQVFGGRKFPNYISQVRLSQMTTPNVALVKHDDPTNLASRVPVCYVSRARGFSVRGTITLELKMVFRSDGKILVGEIALLSEVRQPPP
jgi:hypothetical protein